MTLLEQRSYDFRTAGQWAAGVRHGLALTGDRLVVPARLRVERQPGPAMLPAVDPRGDPLWLERRSRVLIRRSLEQGVLHGAGPARLMVAGRSVIWVLASSGVLDRYDAYTRQPLSPVPPRAGWRISDAAGDGADGLWLAETDGSGRWRLRHADCWGFTCRTPIAVTGLEARRLAVTAGGTRLVVIDPATAGTAVVIDAETGQAAGTIGLDAAHRNRPVLLTAAPGNGVVLLSFSEQDETALYERIDVVDGDVEDHQRLRVPRSLGRPTALAGALVGGSRGNGRIVAGDSADDDRRSTFITPALISPEGPHSGWNRAELDLSLPSGTAAEVTWASTGNAMLIERAGRLIDGPATAGLADELDQLLPWRTEQAVRYRGTGDGAVEHLAALLDGVAETTLWLRIRLDTPAGRTPPQMSRLRVRYPAVSYLDHLPAFYREDPRSAPELRRILAPYEMLFDGLDETLAGLAQRLDPGTAPDEWTGYLLSWLGFPPLNDLPADRRRDLLAHAGDILGRRGTQRGLELMLDVVTEGRATVTDTAGGPSAWFLGASARLGRDTRALAQRPASARAGAMVLGRTPLGRGCPDPALMLAQRAGVVTIRLDLDAARQSLLAPIIDRLLPFFVPAHCRVRLVYSGAASTDRRPDVDFRLDESELHSDGHWRLGATTRLGRWPLPEPARRPAVLDQGPLLLSGPRLQ
ncbi:hypothetical protein ACGFJ7_12335 [Actinoplanes sp. NPDC048988]|uniref:hypothetical protein n=1 Tax=Actinoplanes sp. NPDC048988 TaxID=3363901 RepID=UPI00371FAD03